MPGSDPNLFNSYEKHEIFSITEVFIKIEENLNIAM